MTPTDQRNTRRLIVFAIILVQEALSNGGLTPEQMIAQMQLWGLSEVEQLTVAFIVNDLFRPVTAA